jgi:hypothetical protein
MGGSLSSWASGALLLVIAAVPAQAQIPRPERPYRGLFASTGGDANQVLTGSASVGVGWDDNLLAATRSGDSGLPSRNLPAVSGGLGTVKGGLNYSFRSELIGVTIAGTTASQYFPTLDDEFVRASQGRVGLSVSPRRGPRFSLSMNAARQPYALSSLFSEEVGVVGGFAELLDLDAVLAPEGQLTYGGSFNVSQQLSRRTSMALNYSYRASERPDYEHTFELKRGGARLSHQLNRDLALVAGYSYGEGVDFEGEPFPHHNIDVGLDFMRALSLTRRTTVTFTTGSAATRTNDRLRFHLTGDAMLTHEIGRTWAAWGAYGRHVTIHETWREPGLNNTVAIGLGGLPTRRIQLQTAARVALGSIGLQYGAPGFDHYYFTSSLAYALARFVNVSVAFSHYQHNIDEDVRLAVGIPRNLSRHSVRVGINLWAPIFERTRRTNASR